MEVRLFRAILDDVLYIAQGCRFSISQTEEYRMISASKFKYYPFCDDFGPLNMSCVIRFIEILNSEIIQFPSHKIVVYAEPGQDDLANAAFLLGAYLIIQRELPLAYVRTLFSWADTLIPPYRDITNTLPEFPLTLVDCFSALARARSHGWVLPATSSEPSIYGQINVEEYEHYDDPWNGDLHEVVS